jgi:Icc-related predicted phosphoesterase
VRVYFCSDIHASEKCWKKFLATPKFYDADVIIVGGDVTGKFVVPIVEAKRGKYSCRYAGIERRLSPGADVERMKGVIADAGSYAYMTTPEECTALEADPEAVDRLFRELIMERVDRWIDMADDRLGGTGVRVFVSGANDDYFEVDGAIARSEVIEDPNGTVIPLDDGFEIMGMGFGNVTPWACPRDIEESELRARIDGVAERVTDPARTIFSLHVPPYDSGLDYAPELDEELRMVTNGGGLNMVPVGSTSTRDAVADYRPMIGLHGHIHESRGVRAIDGVPIANPGSEYGEGILDGIVLDLDRQHGLVNTTLVRG